MTQFWFSPYFHTYPTCYHVHGKVLVKRGVVNPAFQPYINIRWYATPEMVTYYAHIEGWKTERRNFKRRLKAKQGQTGKLGFNISVATDSLYVCSFGILS